MLSSKPSLVFVVLVACAPSILCDKFKDETLNINKRTKADGYSIVATQYGKIRGSRKQIDDKTILDVFLGVPYAAPPVGELRWMRPQPPQKWSGVKDALKFSNQCSQRVLSSAPQAATPYSEDCLYLDIYAPKFSGSSTPLPVMLWIHGGGYFGGTGEIYNGTELSLRGVVVVNFNYRLDVFGFLATSDMVIPGNFGMLDQIQVMDWVRDNIASFGGDPFDITIFGQSAGASSASLHLLSPLSRGKFHKAIMESGVSSCMWATNPSNTTYYAPTKMAQLLGLAVGCSHPNTKDLLSCLRRIETEYLVNASVAIQVALRDAMVWVPVVENVWGFLPDLPSRLWERGDVADVSTIRGYNHNELGISVKDPDNKGYSVEKFATLLVTTAYFFYQKNDALVAAAIEAEYLKQETTAIGRRDDFARLMGDMYMTAPITWEAQRHSELQKNAKSYLYEFSYRASFSTLPVWQGVVHTDELPFVFGLPKGPAQLAYNSTTQTDQIVANNMVTLWTNFAKYGNPTPPAKSKKSKIVMPGIESKSKQHLNFIWPALNDESNAVLEINSTCKVGNYLKASEVRLWMQEIPAIEKFRT